MLSAPPPVAPSAQLRENQVVLQFQQLGIAPVLLAALGMPAEVAAEVERYCRRNGRGARVRAAAEELLKLRFHFGGRTVITAPSPQGLEVLAADLTSPEEVRTLMSQLRDQGRKGVTIHTLPSWHDTTPKSLGQSVG